MAKTKKKGLSLSTTIVLIISAFSFTVTAILGTVLTFQSVNNAKQMVSSKTLELAAFAAAMIDGDAIKDIKAEDKDTKAYQDAYDALSKFKSSNEAANGEFAYIYLCRATGENTFEFTIDASADPAGFGEDLEWTKALESASKGVAAFDSEPYTDRWGTFYSAYSPIFDSNNEVVMIVGIDVWADWYNNTIWSNAKYTIGISIAAVVSGILIGVLISINIRKRFEVLSKEFNELENDVKTLISEIKEPTDISNDDNNGKDDQVTELREKIHITQKEVKEYIIYTKKRAYTDSLAQVGNRALYIERVDKIDFSVPFAIIIIDINGLKYINDKYGHEIGDKSIVAVSNILKAVFNEDDIYRIGGDEFAILLTEVDKEVTLDVINSLNKRFDNYNDKKILPFILSISKGVAFYDKRRDKTFTDVFNRADENMYKDKEAFYDANPKLKKRYLH